MKIEIDTYNLSSSGSGKTPGAIINIHNFRKISKEDRAFLEHQFYDLLDLLTDKKK